VPPYTSRKRVPLVTTIFQRANEKRIDEETIFRDGLWMEMKIQIAGRNKTLTTGGKQKQLVKF